MKKLLFVFNPYSGKAQIKYKLLEIVDIFVKADYEVTIFPTQGREDALNIVASKAKKYHLVVCSGGDGTLDEVVAGMMKSKEKRPIAFIPAGSTNDYANSLGIPRSMTSAAKLAVTGKPVLCDIGDFNGNSFVYVAAFGLFTEVSYKTNQQLKNILGHTAYILEGAKRLYDIRSYHVKFELNGKEYEDDIIYGMITNSVSIGGFKDLAGKNVALDDGKFEVTLIRQPKNPLELNEIIWNLTTLKDDTDLIYSGKIDHIVIECDEEIPWTLDGEYGGNHKVANIRNLQNQLEFVVKGKNPKKIEIKN